MKNYTKVLTIFIIALVMEVIIFNFTSYRILFGNYERKEIEVSEEAYHDGDKTYLSFENLNIDIGTIKINFKQDLDKVSEYKVYFSDETSSEYRGLDSKVYIPKYEKSQYMPLYLSGKVNGLKISVDSEVYNNNQIESVVINEKIPFEFNIIRFLVVFSFILLLYLLKHSIFFNKSYSPKDMKQEIFLIVILAIFFIVLTWINQNSTYKANETIYNEDFLNAVLKGNFYLDKEPSEEFLKLENPYDDLARSSLERGEDYEWDTAYYNGKFYIYFGILPLIAIFLPYYLITKKYLSMAIVVYIFSIFVFLLIKEILQKIVARYFEKIPFKFVVYFFIILCSGSLILYANGMSRVYELVIIAGLYCVLQGIFFILKSLESDKNKYLNIFLGCVFLALSVACRPTDLLASIIILPYLISLLIKNIKMQNKKDLLKLIFAVAIPYMVVGISLMWYNYIRFDNPFEFGAKYQLTIVDMKSLGNRVFSIPTGIIANLFSIPRFTAKFPFLINQNDLLEFYGYYYIENMIGGLFMLAPICFMNFFVFKINKKSENKELKIVINTLLIVGLVIAILSIMMAGSNQRYLIDYAWMLILSGILIFMSFYNLLKSNEAKKIFKYILCFVTIYTCFVGVFSGILSEKNYLQDRSPEAFYKVRYTMCFWE